jgi:membrane fusion protein, multidrug efflux system
MSSRRPEVGNPVPTTSEEKSRPGGDGAGRSSLERTPESNARPEATTSGELRPQRSARSFAVPLASAVALLLLVAGVVYWRANIGLVKTDNAQTMGDLAPISAQVSGRVVRVDVVQDQYVRAGAVLVELDQTDYRIALNQAQASLAAAQAQVHAAQAALVAQQQQYETSLSVARTSLAATEPALPQAVAQLQLQEGTTAAQLQQAEQAVTTARAQLQAAQAALTTAGNTLSRDKQLFAQGAISAQQLDADTSAYQSALANEQAARDALRQAEAGVASAEANRKQVLVAQQAVEANRAQIAHAEALLRQAEAGDALVRQRAQELASAEAQAAVAAQAVQTAQVNLGRTFVRAPADGWVGSTSPVGFSVEPGQVVQPNQPLLYLTLAHHIWVVANIKETQLGRIRVGDPVRVRVDALGGRVFPGRVESIGSTTGASTALLPPDNATGNFIKVVQLVPVRIALDPGTDPQRELQVGLSVEVTIDTRGKSR